MSFGSGRQRSEEDVVVGVDSGAALVEEHAAKDDSSELGLADLDVGVRGVVGVDVDVDVGARWGGARALARVVGAGMRRRALGVRARRTRTPGTIVEALGRNDEGRRPRGERGQ